MVAWVAKIMPRIDNRSSMRLKYEKSLGQNQTNRG